MSLSSSFLFNYMLYFNRGETMARVRKCDRCKEKTTEYKTYKNKAICENCYSTYINGTITCTTCKIQIKRINEYIGTDIDKSDTSKNFCSQDCYNKLLENRKILEEIDMWLKEYFKMDRLNPRVYMQLNEFQTKFNMTPQGILYTLNYIKNETNKEILSNSLTIVTWYYETAKNNYLEKQKLKTKIEEFNKINSSMFQSSNSKVKVLREPDNRKDKILITEINFN